jgi:hypothetical protein
LAGSCQKAVAVNVFFDRQNLLKYFIGWHVELEKKKDSERKTMKERQTGWKETK